LSPDKKQTIYQSISFMNNAIEEILWNIYYQSSNRIGGRRDFRFVVLNEVLEDIHEFTGKQLTNAVYDLKRQKLIEKKKDYEGSILISLTEKGVLRAINYKFRRLNDKKEKWDSKWRMLAFDIPESHRKARNALRYRFKMGGFYELQESIFLYPYDCKKEIDAFVKLFKLEKYVRFGLLDFIDIEDKLKFHFKITE